MAQSALYARFKTDSALEESGVMVDFGEGIRVRVRRFKSRVVQDAAKKYNKTETGVIRKGSLSDDVAEDILHRVIADAVIAGWEGITDEHGNTLEPTFDNKYKVVRELPEFRDAIFQQSTELDNFKAAQVKEAEGNFAAS